MIQEDFHILPSDRGKKRRRQTKGIITFVLCVVATALCLYLFLYSDFELLLMHHKWRCYIGIGLLVVIFIFIVSMWGLEAKKDPSPEDIEWIGHFPEHCFEMYRKISAMWVEHGKSQSWILGFPFSLLGTAVLLVELPIRAIVKLAALIK